MHIHALAGNRKWIDNYGKIMWATIKMEPNLYKELALPGENFDGFGAAVELRDLEDALRKDIKIRVNENIMDRARNVLRIMEYMMKDSDLLKNQPLSKKARAQAEAAVEQAYQTAKTSVLRHLREGHGVAGPAPSAPSTSSKPSIPGRQPSMQARSPSIDGGNRISTSRRSSRSIASSSKASRQSRNNSMSSVSSNAGRDAGPKA